MPQTNKFLSKQGVEKKFLSKQEGLDITLIAVDMSNSYDTSNATVNENDIVNGKVAYGSNGKIIGRGNLYNTSDATVTSSNITQGKVAYNRYGQITGTGSPAPKQEIQFNITPSISDVVTTPPDNTLYSGGVVKGVLLSGTASEIIQGSQIKVLTDGNTLLTLTGTMPVLQSSSVTLSGNTVTVQPGYYSEPTLKTVSLATSVDPVITKSAVSNYSVTLTPLYTTYTGYVLGSTKSASATVNLSELISGNTETVTNNVVDKDVTNLQTLRTALTPQSFVSGTYQVNNYTLPTTYDVLTYEKIRINITPYDGGIR